MSSNILINVMPALYGDAIYFRFLDAQGEPYNMFIDGGFSRTYELTLKKTVQKIINADEKVDLFVVTHSDQDHISGVIRLLREFGDRGVIERFWFNHSLVVTNILQPNNKISHSQGLRLSEQLGELGIKVNSNVTDAISDFELRSAHLEVIAPSSASLEEYRAALVKEEFLQRQKQPVAVVKSDYGSSIDQLTKEPFKEDNGFDNRTSIAFILRAFGRSFLFLGDSPPSVIVGYLRFNGFSVDRKLQVDCMKISHHSSRSSTSNELLSLIDCNRFLISANGLNRYCLPHKEALARIVAHPFRDFTKHIVFHFNYDNKLLRRIFSKEEMTEYNFSCCFPRKPQDGCIITY